MDPATIISLLAAAAGALGIEVVKDAYQLTKKAMRDFFAKEEDLLEALDDLEAKPQSRLKQETLQGQMENATFLRTENCFSTLPK